MYRTDQIHKIKSFLNSKSNENHSKVVSIYGKWGIGKTYLLNNMNTNIFEDDEESLIVYYNQVEKNSLLSEFILQIFNSIAFSIENNKYVSTEISFYDEKFKDISKVIKNINTDRFNLFQETFRLDSLEINEMDKFYYENKIDQIKTVLNKSSDKKNLDYYLISITEAFFVDLVKMFYPNILEELSNSESQFLNKPLKINMVLDDIYPIHNKFEYYFVNYLLNYLNNKSYNEFECYDLNFSNHNLKISDLFNFNFIFSSRKIFNIKKINSFESMELLKENYLDIQLEPLTRIEIENLLAQEGIDTLDIMDDAEKLSNGNPYVLALYIESFKIDGEFIDYIQIQKIAFDMLSKYFTEIQIEWLRSAAALNKFNKWSLRLFPSVRENYVQAYNFIKNCSDLVDITSGNLLRIKALTKTTIMETLDEESHATFIALNKINEFSESFLELSMKINDDDFEYIRNLSYFKRFNTHFALEAAFQNDFENVKKINEKYPDFFRKEKYTISWDEEIRNILKQYNKYIEENKYEPKKKLIEEIWNEYIGQLELRNLDLSREINQVIEELKIIEDDKENYEKNIDKIKSIIENSNIHLSEIKKKLIPFTKKSNEQKHLILVSISMLMFLFAITVHNFLGYDTFVNPYTIVFSIVGLSLLGLSSKYLIQKLRLNTKRHEFTKYKSEFALIETNIAKEKESLSIIQADLNAVLSKIIELKKHIDQINLQLHENQLRLSEPFI